MSTLNTSTAFVAAATIGVFAVSTVSAATQLDIDLNNFNVMGSTTSDGFVLDLSDDGDTEIQNIRIDGSDAGGFTDPFPDFPASFTGQLQLSGDASSGDVVGGFYNLSDGQGNVFSFSDATGSYFDSGTGIGVVLEFASNSGNFNTDMFAGVDVSTFSSSNALPVSVIAFFFDPSVLSSNGGTDQTADSDITVVIPSPVPRPPAWHSWA